MNYGIDAVEIVERKEDKSQVKVVVSLGTEGYGRGTVEVRVYTRGYRQKNWESHPKFYPPKNCTSEERYEVNQLNIHKWNVATAGNLILNKAKIQFVKNLASRLNICVLGGGL